MIWATSGVAFGATVLIVLAVAYAFSAGNAARCRAPDPAVATSFGERRRLASRESKSRRSSRCWATSASWFPRRSKQLSHTHA